MLDFEFIINLFTSFVESKYGSYNEMLQILQVMIHLLIYYLYLFASVKFFSD